MRSVLSTACAATLLVGWAQACVAWAKPTLASAGLAELSLEQLGEVEVYSVALRDVPLIGTAAAVHVLHGNDIRRAGARSLPEALRLVPVLDVARADANQYAISARGFNNVLANKMLVVIDGRAVYSPLFSGVFWEAQGVAMDDIDRIEVVTGPSNALWGTNAVNGLIHVVTKSAKDTVGGLASGHAGTDERGAWLRHGWRVGGGAVRLYAQTIDRDDTRRTSGESVVDASHAWQAGFRGKWNAGGTALTLQGDHFSGASDQPPDQQRTYADSNLLARASGRTGPGADWTVQAYVDRSSRRHPGIFREDLLTADVVAQVGRVTGAHQWLVGAGYRAAQDETSGSPALAFIPANRSLHWARVFANDEISFGEHLKTTLSMSLEHNPYTGTEVLPQMRVAWSPAASVWLWGSLSRAVRAPSRLDRELYQPAEPPFALAGGPDFASEVSHVLELGLRAQPDPALSFGFTLFRHEHHRLRSLALTAEGAQFRNDIDGHSQGLQAWTSWRVGPAWRLGTGLVLLDQALRVREGRVDLGGINSLGNDPAHWASLRSMLDLGDAWCWDLQIRHVGARPLPEVPAYTAVDTRLAWRPRPTMEAALVVRNAADPGHPEWGAVANRVELRRSAELQWQWAW